MAVDIKLKRSHTHSNIPTTSDLSEGEFAINTYDGKMYMCDGSSNIVTVGSHYTTDFESTTKTFYVTVATSTSDHVHHGNGSSNKYKINGVFSPYLKLIPGITYRFDQSDSSNSGHPFRFYLDENKNTSYTTGVTTNGTAGSSGAYTEIVVTHSTPPVLHYQCSAHGLMGWAAFVNTSNLTAFDTGDLTEGSNLYYTDARAQSAAQSVSINNVVEDTTPQLGGNLDVNAKNINFGDSASSSDDRLNFGAGTDLSIYHDGSDNTIKTTSDLNFDASGEVVISGTSQFETKDFVVSGSRTGTGGAVSRLILRNRAGSTDINANNQSTFIEGWRLQGNTPSLILNFGGTERHRFDPDGKIALGAVPSSFGSITETVEITGTLKTTSTAKLTGVQLLGGLDLNSQDITGTGNINTSGNLTLTSTDTGSSAAPELSLVRDSASPADADYLGQIRFLGDDDGGSQHVYAKITGKIGDASAGTEDGIIEIANVKAGTNTITARFTSSLLKLLNGTGLTVAGNTTLSGTLNGHTIPGGSGTLALTTDIQSGGVTVQDEGSSLSTLGTTLNFVGAGVTASGTGATKTITISGGGGSSSGENVSWSVTQSSHGLAVGDVIYNNGSAYVKAQANATGTLGLFVVSAVADTNTFTATFSGKITLSSLTAGQYYFVSTTTAGDFTATEPTSGYSNPILFALSTTEAVVLPFRPQDLTAGGAAGARTALDVFSKSETNAQISAFSIALG